MKRFHVSNEGKIEYIRVEIINKFDDFKKWISRNSVQIAEVAVPVLIAVVPVIVKRGIKARDLRKVKEVKELYCYDRSLGHYWALKRELTNSEWVMIDKRKANGERLADILEELRVLK